MYLVHNKHGALLYLGNESHEAMNCFFGAKDSAQMINLEGEALIKKLREMGYDVANPSYAEIKETVSKDKVEKVERTIQQAIEDICGPEELARFQKECTAFGEEAYSKAKAAGDDAAKFLGETFTQVGKFIKDVVKERNNK